MSRSSPTPLLTGLLGLVALLLGAAPAPAQGFDLLVSTSSDDAVPSGPVRDEDVLRHAPGQPARVVLPAESLASLAGDQDGDGLLDVPGDVDALHDGGAALVSDGLYVSLISDEGSFRDGDVLVAGSAGWEVFLSEDAFVTATGATDGNVDVDALQIDPDGTVLFSFAENEDSSLLSGDAPGVIGDGDVLSWVPGSGAAASVLYTEDGISALVDAAVGGGVGSTGDTKGLARDPSTGAVLFCVQSPSAEDGAVFSTDGGGSRLTGHAESDFGFSGSGELDALTVASTDWPALTVADGMPGPTETLAVTVSGAEPGQPYVMLFALDRSPAPWVPLQGWGGLVLADDVAFTAALLSVPALTVVPDAQGRATFSLTVPAVQPPLDLVFQAVSWGGPPTGSNPVAVEVSQ